MAGSAAASSSSTLGPSDFHRLSAAELKRHLEMGASKLSDEALDLELRLAGVYVPPGASRAEKVQLYVQTPEDANAQPKAKAKAKPASKMCGCFLRDLPEGQNSKSEGEKMLEWRKKKVDEWNTWDEDRLVKRLAKLGLDGDGLSRDQLMDELMKVETEPKANKKAAAAKGAKKAVKTVLHSSNLVWECIRNNNSFLRPNKTALAKRWKKGPRNVASQVFNAEPGHLSGVNGFSCSTLAGQGLSVGVQKTGTKQTVVVSTKVAGQKGARKPAKAVAKTGIAKNAKKGAKTLTAKVSKAYYRRDLTAKANAKYAAVLKSFKSKQPKLKISTRA